MKKILLSQDKVVFVDDGDFDYLNQWSWNLGADGYVRSKINRKTIYLHRLVLDAKKGWTVDHISRNKLDNRRRNLRLCTRLDNSRNKSLQKNNTSGFKGVSWEKSRRKWSAHIYVNNKNKMLGRFSTATDAAEAYNQAAREAYGAFANLNRVVR